MEEVFSLSSYDDEHTQQPNSMILEVQQQEEVEVERQLDSMLNNVSNIIYQLKQEIF